MNMLLYIDPGTGSMLFTILLGLVGAGIYSFRMLVVKLKFFFSSGKAVADKGDRYPYVIFSDNKRYWNIFEPICREFDKRGIDIVYLTASPDDPALNCEYEHVKGEFIGEGNKAFAKLNFLKADIVLSTTPGLDVYQWKRSRDVKYYVHIFHAASDATLYRSFGIDYYDAVLTSGEFQENEIRALEKLRNLPEKEFMRIGIPYMDEMKVRLDKVGAEKDEDVTVLLAPTWGSEGMLSKYGKKIIDTLLSTGYKIIIRPHPQSFISEKELMDTLMDAYPESEKLKWNRDNDNFDVLRKSDIMISDFSGVIFDFALIYDKPVIYSGSDFDTSLYDAWWLDEPVWTKAVLPKLGKELNEENFSSLREMIDECLHDDRYAIGREEARKDCWEYLGEGTIRTVEYLTEKWRNLEGVL